MRPTARRALVAASACLLAAHAALAFDTPLYINMGGPETVDSSGRTWLGDQGAGLDPLGIRPDDTGGANTIEAWCGPSAQSVEALPTPESVDGIRFAPTDDTVFRSIRWDEGAVGAPYLLEIPVDPGSYRLTLYFCEQCCPQRHFKIEVQGELLFADVSSGLYAAGAAHTPGALVAEDVVVAEDGILSIALLPCLDPECPGGTDANPILSALAVVPTGFDPCTNPSFRACASELRASIDGSGVVTGTWSAPVCVTPLGYDLYRDGELVESLGPDATSFSAPQPTRAATWSLETRLAEGEPPCPPLASFVLREDVPFDVPLRINMGGPQTVDSRGRTWLGDGSGNVDPLRIRPDLAGGTNAIVDWCSKQQILAQPDALGSLGFDAYDPGDASILSTIRWDLGDDDGDTFVGEAADTDGGDTDFRLEIPLPDGDYQVRLYFVECLNDEHPRRFQVEVQGVIVEEDFGPPEYTPVHRAGRAGWQVADGVAVSDGVLSVGLLPCPDCPVPDGAVIDPNPVITAVEVLPAGTPWPRCIQQLACVLDPASGEVTGSFTDFSHGGEFEFSGYDVLRNGEKILDLAADTYEFTDTPPCERALVYEVVPRVDGDASPCPDLHLVATVVQPDCPFGDEVRVNMAGIGAFDSNGDYWLGDPGAGLDTLGIRPVDGGGTNAAEYWSLSAYQPGSVERFGLDGAHLGVEYIFNTIRWDPGGDADPYVIEVPLERGIYSADLWFNEGCCPGRHFRLEVEGEVWDEDVSYLDYDPDQPDLGRLGVIGDTGILVEDGSLEIRLIGCLDPECPGSTDNNAILDALEVHLETRLNDPPTAVVTVTPESGEVQLAAGEARVTLDGSASDDGDEGAQGLTYAWVKVEGPDGDTIEAADAAATDVVLTAEGTYVYGLTVDDGEAESNTDEAEVTILVLAEPGTRFVRGDPDSSGSIVITDGIVVLGYLFLGEVEPACLDSADADDSGELNLTDAIYIFNWLFLGGPKPVAPVPSDANYLGADCGLDTTEDALDCATPGPICQ